MDAIVFVPEKLIRYRQHDSNQIGGMPITPAVILEKLFGSRMRLIDSLGRENENLEFVSQQLGARIPRRNQQIAHDRIAHNTWRMGLPKSRLLRLWPVVWGVIQGRYARYGRQPHDVLRDLLMPPREILLGLYRAVVQRQR